MSDKLDSDAAVDRAIGAIGASGSAGEVFLREGWSTSVEVRDGTVENVISRGERGIGVRVLRDGRAGFAYTSDLTRDGIAACVDAARDMSVVTEPDPHLRLADVPLTPVDLGLVDQDEERSVAERTEVALAVERAARAADPRITAFRKTTYGDGVTTNILANTGGVRGAYRAAYYSVGTSAVATDGEERQIGSHSQASRRFADLDTEATGRRAAQLATAKLGARAIPTQRLAVVLDPYMGMALLGAIAPLFSADSVLKGKSLFASKIGEQVANEQVTIVDDARAPGGLRSSPFDGEGVETTTRTLLDRGVLRGYLSSLKTASKMGIAPTGNARRGSYAQPGRIGVANFRIEAGDADPEAMVASLDRALRITSLLNLHTVDPISGEFSLGATGDYLERGTRVHPVQGITIAGNLTTLLASVSGIGRDLTVGAAGIGSPTLLISELQIGGT